MDWRKATGAILALVVLTAVAALVVAGLATVLSWAGDRVAAAVVGWVAVGLGVVWVVGLVILVLAVAAGQATLGAREDREWGGGEMGADEMEGEAEGKVE